ncbi:uncharacterized protein CTRU02_203071 [Colletotrichum truncatum]|uniref:Uncharacterized protein n=1 Tax=Colletotrichum truncatum TaxID=5467 RepID=A0ACC3Z8C9_COLTU|nr:uncharacterized protein CTRU02_08908 [Colletotrichum truncatum]KAF6789116.1 hypothetical protein CTRU02_08908 [Colletotrichum truncatum]
MLLGIRCITVPRNVFEGDVLGISVRFRLKAWQG